MTALHEEVAGRDWYHTLELGDGITTPGWFDTRELATRLPMPPDLHGKRCLDIGTYDGFWAFEMERRGGAVTAIDILDDTRWDWPANASDGHQEAIEQRKGRGDGFLIAGRALGSSVQRLDCSIYELDPAVHGSFDFVYLGSLLLHLRDPVLALERVRAVTGGQLLIVDAIALGLTLLGPRSPWISFYGDGRPYWCKPNRVALVRMAQAAGWRPVARPRMILMPAGAGFHHPSGLWPACRSARGREALFASRVGDPHAALLVEPAH
ncbi:MAG TPA: methyltransferase domain-containing protein [Solirubrobacteraceae bacterium]